MILLGLDLSISATGYCLYDTDKNKVLSIGTINTKSTFQKKGVKYSYPFSVRMKTIIDALYNEVIENGIGADDFCIIREAMPLGFSITTAKTITTLAKVHGVIEYFFRDTEMIDVHSTKVYFSLFGKTERENIAKVKKVDKNYKKKATRHKINKMYNLELTSYDEVDAVSVIDYFCKIEGLGIYKNKKENSLI